MALPAPIVPINEWACGIASLCWHVARLGKGNLNQDQVIISYFAHFPKWAGYKGITEVSDLLEIQELMGLEIRRALLSSDATEVLDFLKKYKADYLMGFIVSRIPTCHVMALGEWTDTEVTYMDAARPTAQVITEKWTDMMTAFDPVVFLSFR